MSGARNLAILILTTPPDLHGLIDEEIQAREGVVAERAETAGQEERIERTSSATTATEEGISHGIAKAEENRLEKETGTDPKIETTIERAEEADLLEMIGTEEATEEDREVVLAGLTIGTIPGPMMTTREAEETTDTTAIEMTEVIGMTEKTNHTETLEIGATEIKTIGEMTKEMIREIKETDLQILVEEQRELRRETTDLVLHPQELEMTETTEVTSLMRIDQTGQRDLLIDAQRQDQGLETDLVHTNLMLLEDGLMIKSLIKDLFLEDPIVKPMIGMETTVRF